MAAKTFKEFLVEINEAFTPLTEKETNIAQTFWNAAIDSVAAHFTPDNTGMVSAAQIAAMATGLLELSKSMNV